MTYHQEGSNDPVQEYAKGDLNPDFSCLKDPMQSLVLYFAENGVHHNQQSDRYNQSASCSGHLGIMEKFHDNTQKLKYLLTYGNRDTNECSLLQRWPGVWDEIPQNDTDCHGKQYPQGQKAIQDSKAFEQRLGFGSLLITILMLLLDVATRLCTCCGSSTYLLRFWRGHCKWDVTRADSISVSFFPNCLQLQPCEIRKTIWQRLQRQTEERNTSSWPYCVMFREQLECHCLKLIGYKNFCLRSLRPSANHGRLPS